MKEIITNLFGAYTPVMTQAAVVVSDADGTSSVQYIDVIASGLAGVDWPWLIGAVSFLLCLYCFFRIVGMLFKR